MATENIKSDKGHFGIIRNGYLPLESETEIVRLSVGSNIAKVGHIMTYKGEVTAGTHTTHRDVTHAASGNAAGNTAFKFAGVILSPEPIPSETYTIDDVLTDGTFVKILKPTGGKAVLSMFYTDNSDDVLPGQMLSLDTAGKLKKTAFTFTATPTVTELETALSSYTELVGISASAVEDVGGSDIIVDVTY